MKLNADIVEIWICATVELRQEISDGLIISDKVEISTMLQIFLIRMKSLIKVSAQSKCWNDGCWMNTSSNSSGSEMQIRFMPAKRTAKAVFSLKGMHEW